MATSTKIAYIIGGTFIGLIALVFIIGFVMSATAPKPTPAPEPVLALSASQLIEEYKKNKVRADREYKGSLLLVSGRISEIEGDGKIYLQVGSAFEFDDVRATLKDKDALIKLDRGMQVELLCRGDGIADFIGITAYLKDCELEQEG